MREILFRGKTETGKWVEGFLVPYSVNTYRNGVEIITPDGINYDELDYYQPSFSSDYVDPETVGQFTGITDKNGKKVFEGDIVKDNLLECKLLSSSGKKPRTGVAVVKYGDHEVPSDDPFEWGYAFGVYFEGDTLFPTPSGYGEVIRGTRTEFEVIGNIYDNPEFLMGGDQG